MSPSYSELLGPTPLERTDPGGLGKWGHGQVSSPNNADVTMVEGEVQAGVLPIPGMDRRGAVEDTANSVLFVCI